MQQLWVYGNWFTVIFKRFHISNGTSFWLMMLSILLGGTHWMWRIPLTWLALKSNKTNFGPLDFETDIWCDWWLMFAKINSKNAWDFFGIFWEAFKFWLFPINREILFDIVIVWVWNETGNGKMSNSHNAASNAGKDFED